MSVFARFYAGIAFAMVIFPSQAVAACGSHTVVRGETLRSIAIRYFGTDARTFEMFEMNRNVIGDNQDLIEIGQILALPCDDSIEFVEEATAMPINVSSSFASLKIEATSTKPEIHHAMSGGSEQVATPSLDMALAMADEIAHVSMVEDVVFSQGTGDGILHLLTGGPFPPFVDDRLDQGGLMPHLVEAAFNKTPDQPDFEIDYVNDRAAHLETIMPRGGFDLAFPWPYPDCTRTGLDTEALQICQNYLASDPIYEMVTEYYARADSRFAGALVATDLIGASLCRPTGMPVADLEALGLLPDKVTLVRGGSPTECLRRLDEGMVDVASMDSSIARSLIQSIGITQPLVVLERFTRVETLHVLAPKADPMASEKLARFNQGLLRISESGEWFEIVNRHITAN